jgi:hypothetical protein
VFEITAGCTSKYRISSVVVMPPINEQDILDIQFNLRSKKLPGYPISAYVTVEANGEFLVRCYQSNGGTISELARQQLRQALSSITKALLKTGGLYVQI